MMFSTNRFLIGTVSKKAPSFGSHSRSRKKETRNSVDGCKDNAPRAKPGTDNSDEVIMEETIPIEKPGTGESNLDVTLDDAMELDEHGQAMTRIVDEIDASVIRNATGEFSSEYFGGCSFERIKIPDYVTRIEDISTAIAFVFAKLDLCEPTQEIGKKSILAFKNEVVDHINAICLDQIPYDSATELVGADSCFKWVSHDHNGDPADMSLQSTGIPPCCPFRRRRSRPSAKATLFESWGSRDIHAKR